MYININLKKVIVNTKKSVHINKTHFLSQDSVASKYNNQSVVSTWRFVHLQELQPLYLIYD